MTNLVIAAYDMPATDLLQKQIDSFQLSASVCIERFSADRMEKEVLAELESGGSRFDVIDVSIAAVPAFSEHLVPLDAAARGSLCSCWSKRLGNLFSLVGDEYVTIPWRGDAYLSYYRKDLLDAPGSLDEVLSAAERLHDPDGGMSGFASSQRNGLHICLDWLCVFWGLGGRLWDEESLLTSLASECGRSALEYYCRRNRYAPNGVSSFGFYDPLRCLIEGRVAIVQQWSMARSVIAQSTPRISGDIGYAPAAGTPVIGGGGLAVSKYSRQQTAAWELIRFATTHEAEKQRVLEGGSPTRLDVFSDSEVRERCPHVAAIEQCFLRGRIRPRNPEWNRIQDMIGECVWSSCHGSRELAEALERADSQLRGILQIQMETRLGKSISAIGTNGTAPQILTSVLMGYGQLKGAVSGNACLVDNNQPVPDSWVHWPNDNAPGQSPNSQSLTASILATADTVWIVNDAMDSSTSYVVGLRFTIDGNANGIMFWNFASRQRITFLEREHLEILANHVANNLAIAEANKERHLLEEHRQSLGRILHDSLNEIYISDAETGQFVEANRGALQNTGYSLDELRKLTPTDIKPGLTREALEQVTKPLHSGEKETVTLRRSVHRRKDGSSYPVETHLEITTFLGRKAIVAIVLDTTERDAAEASFQALLESAPDGMVLVDLNGNVGFINEQVERMFGYQQHELVGGPVEKLMPVRYHSRYERLRVEFFAAPRFRTMGCGNELFAVRKDGREFPVEISLSLVTRSDGEFVCGAIRDVSEKVRNQQRLLQAERLSAIGQAMTGLIHESRNGLARSQAGLKLLSRELGTRPELSRYINEALQAQKDVQLLFEEVRQYAAPTRLELRTTNVPELVEQTWGRLQDVSDVRDVTLSQMHTGVDVECQLDGFVISKVFRNLIENSLAACRDPVRITIHYGNSKLHGENALAMSFQDNGPGFAEESTEHAFDPFYTTKTRGTGLGLAIVKQSVEQHRGKITLCLEKKGGASFDIVLPKGN